MNILYGLYTPDEGEIRVRGEKVVMHSPRDAIAQGIGMVHQHFMLIPVMTVAENVVLADEPRQGAVLLDYREAERRVRELAARFKFAIDPAARIQNISVAQQQRVEILKALYRDAQCLILDEPTAVLTPTEIDELMDIVRQLADGGRSIIFITHKLREVATVADRITVLRGGRVVGETTPAEAGEQALATMMVGHEVQLVVDKEPASPGEPVLEVTDLVVADDRRQPVVNGVSFDVRAGEILALAGVQGNGQSELVEAVCGMRSPESGTLRLSGEDVTGASPAHLFSAGLAHVPEDRQRYGLIGSMPVSSNLVLNQVRDAPFARGLRLDRRAVRRHAADLVEQFDVRTPSVDVAVSTLSGGNQQKVIIAREFFHGDDLLVLSQPTRGLDVGSIQYIHRQVVAKRDEGVAVLLNSSELDEVLALADRIAVIYRGRIVGLVDRADANRELIGLLMAGAVERAAEVEPVEEEEVTVT
jgi:simple sugar transport system ATP-binding protein